MALTIKKIEAAKAKDKNYRISDGNGLSLLILPSGTKTFVYRYRRPVTRKENNITYGQFPELSLADARCLHAHAKALLTKGVDPGEDRKIKKSEESEDNSFKNVASEWLNKNSTEWTPKTHSTNQGRLENHVFPFIGQMPIAEITPKTILAILQRIEAKGIHETAHRVSALCSQVFRYAIFVGKVENDPAHVVKNALPPISKTRKHRAALTDPKEVGKLLRAIEDYTGHYIVKQALRVGLYTFTRSIEIRGMEWDEVDLDRREWRVPSKRMKMRKPHIVPLSSQVLSILNEVKELGLPSIYVFPSVVNNSNMLSENTLNTALRRLGYTKEQLCYHGFRGTCTTLLYETGWPTDMVERQLAHVQTNQVRAAYDHAQYIEERTRMMQSFADYIDSLRDGGSVIPFKKRA
ncbi:Integrase [Maridesulfovibrio ferrireducens]|uniref:Integrase n=1 Tax=Maridesulfovibrio ferrireducens TaxID=246191 RepID=A0A1G9L4R4_9BACT|nr:tyrosine-type recombinase/integrase [Maridesulfovibrio ferrireducens]SDL56743.1 Integrase [Maridesulfovibrio ferrireducens]